MNAVSRLPPSSQREAALEAIRENLARIQFGSISVTIHDGKVVQLEISEKRRFP